LRKISGCFGNQNLHKCHDKLVKLFFYAILKGAVADFVRSVAIYQPNVAGVCDREGNGAMHCWARATRGGKSLAGTGKLLVVFRAALTAQRYRGGMSPLHHLAAPYAKHRGKRDQHKIVILCRFGVTVGIKSTSSLLPVNLISNTFPKSAG